LLADVTDDVYVKAPTVSRSKPACIQEVDYLFVLVFIQQVINRFYYFGSRPGTYIKGQREGNFQDSLGSSLESNLGDNPLLLLQGHILQQQARHALPFPMGKVWIIPDSGEIGGEGEDLLALFGAEDLLVFLRLLFIFFLCCMQGT